MGFFDKLEGVFKFLTLLCMSLAMIRYWQAAGLKNDHGDFRIDLLATTDTFLKGLSELTGRFLNFRFSAPEVYSLMPSDVRELTGFYLLKFLQYLPVIGVFGFRKHFLLYFFLFLFLMVTDGLVTTYGIYHYLDVQSERLLWLGLVGFASTM